MIAQVLPSSEGLCLDQRQGRGEAQEVGRRSCWSWEKVPTLHWPAGGGSEEEGHEKVDIPLSGCIFLVFPNLVKLQRP